MMKVKFLYRQVQRMRNILAILVLFVCVNIGLGDPRQTIIIINRDMNINRDVNEYSHIAGNGDDTDPKSANYGKLPRDYSWKDPNNNRLIIDTGAKVYNASGAYMDNRSATTGDFRSMTNNEVIVNDGMFVGNRTHGEFIAGAWADANIEGDINVSSNRVRITGGTGIENVVGGRAYKGTVYLNTVEISNIIVWDDVYGGHVFDGTATGNKVNLTDVDVKKDVYGARIYHGLASSNEVTITGGKVLNVFGGCIVQSSEVANYGTAIRNKVNLTNVNVTQDVYGAKIGMDGLASSNTVTITSGTVGLNVYGGYIVKDGTATGNKVKLDNVNVKLDVYGARIGKWIGDGLASSNTVTITSGKVRNVYGGYIVNNGTATGNKINLTDVDVTNDVYGAWIGRGLASSNEVTIKGGKICGFSQFKNVHGSIDVYGRIVYGSIDVYGGNVYGGYIKYDGTATLNTVNLDSLTVNSNVYGARIGMGLASSNTVTITGGIIGDTSLSIWDKNVDDVGYVYDGGNVYGGYIEYSGTATGNKVNLTSVTVTNDVYGARIGMGLASSNTVTIKGCIIGGVSLPTWNRNYKNIHVGNVYGGYIGYMGTATLNTVNLTSVTVGQSVYGAMIFGDGYASSNEVTITSGTVGWNVYGAKIGRGLASSNTVTINGNDTYDRAARDVYGGYIEENGTATGNTVNLTSACVARNVYGTRIGSGLASSNTVTIKGGRVWGFSQFKNVYDDGIDVYGKNVYGGYIVKDGTATGNTVNLTGTSSVQNVYGAWIGNDGLASSNTVTINSCGLVNGNVFGGYVKGNGKAIYNTINITKKYLGFSTTTILCGGICADATTNDAFTGNTLNIESYEVVVNGINNFENYKFHLGNMDIKYGGTILTATSGGCSWDPVELDYTPACAVDLSRSNIYLHTQGAINKGNCCTLIKSPQGFKNNIACKQFDFENRGLLVKYYWKIKIEDNKQELIAKLINKKIRDEGVAKSLLEGNITGIACINNGMDCIINKMEESELLLGEGEGETGVFYGLTANKSRYNTGSHSHIDMTEMSIMGGVGKVGKVAEVVEVEGKGQSPKEQSSPGLSSELTTGVFAEYGNGNSDIHCGKKSKGRSDYVGVGVLEKCNIYENEFSGTKVYLEAILRIGRVSSSFKGNEVKDETGKEYKYDYDDNYETVMYGGFALGGGYKHKVSEKIDLDWSLRYMFGSQGGIGVNLADTDRNRVNFENVMSNRIRVGVRGKYIKLENVKPYAGIRYEYELSEKVKGAIQNGSDIVGDIPASSFGGETWIGEVGISGKFGEVLKLGVDISGQGYLGARKGFGGMLKFKYAFGKDAHGSKTLTKPQPKDEEKETIEKETAESEEITTATKSN